MIWFSYYNYDIKNNNIIMTYVKIFINILLSDSIIMIIFNFIIVVTFLIFLNSIISRLNSLSHIQFHGCSNIKFFHALKILLLLWWCASLQFVYFFLYFSLYIFLYSYHSFFINLIMYLLTYFVYIQTSAPFI